MGSDHQEPFVLDNIHSLPVHIVQKNLDLNDESAHYVSVHTFAESLERCVAGYTELTRHIHDLKALIHVLIDRLSIPSAPLTLCSPPLQTNTPPSDNQALEMLPLGRRWPTDFTSVQKMKIQDLPVRYIRDEPSTVAFDTTIRLHKEVQHAITIVKVFADLSSVPTLRPSCTEIARVQFSNALLVFARDTQLMVVEFIESRHKLGQRGKRKRSINGFASGVVKSWGELPDVDRNTVDYQARLQFPQSLF